MTTWTPLDHPRGGGGRFDVKPQSASEARLPAREQLLGSDRLRSADYEVQARSGRQEVSDETALVLAESILQRLPSGRERDEFPILDSVANNPGLFGREDADALHRELGSVYQNLQPAQRPRADALFTWALFGPDSSADPPLL